MLFRLFNLISSRILVYILFSGITTLILARLRAIIETDIKKIVALSTLRQLGLIVARLGLAQPILCFLHLVRHAFFKAIIFISVGTTIHLEGSYQNLKIIGKLSSHPLVLGILIGSNFRLIGLPFFSGFFSKEVIIQRSGGRISLRRIAIYLFFIIRIFITQIYRVRFFIKVILTSNFYLPIRRKRLEMTYLLKAFFTLLAPAIVQGYFFMTRLSLEIRYFLEAEIIKYLVCSTLAIRSSLRYIFYVKNTFISFKLWI